MDPGTIRAVRAEQNALSVIVAISALMAVIFIWDLFVPLGVAMGLLYVAPVMMTLWLPGRRPTLIVTVACSILIVLGYFYSPPGGTAWMVMMNRSLSEGSIWIVALLSSQRKVLEDRLVHKQNEQQMIFDAVPAMIWYKDVHNLILRVNQEAARSIGLPVEHIEGRFTEEFFPDDAAKYHRDDLEVIATGRPKLGIIEDYQGTLAGKRWVRTDKIPYRDSQGNITGVVVFAVDITERIQAEEMLCRSQDELERRVNEALADLKVLHGLLPMCAWCRKVRDDHGYWATVERYVETHSEATFTHGICPQCMPKLAG
ncbi:MAG: PAS domain-containing protein [Nitrospirales bacterium]